MNLNENYFLYDLFFSIQAINPDGIVIFQLLAATRFDNCGFYLRI